MNLSILYVCCLLMTCSTVFTIRATIETLKEEIESVGFKKLYTLKGHKDIVQAMTILKNGLLVSGSADTTIRIWTMDGICTAHLGNHRAWINAIEELANGHIASGSNDGTLNLWDSTHTQCIRLANLEKERIYSNSIIQLHNGNIAFATWKRTVKIWDIAKDLCLQTTTTGLHRAWISSLIEIKNSPYLATSSWDTTIKIWDISQDNPTCTRTLDGHTDCINVIKQLNDYMLVSAADDKTIMMWDINSGEAKATLCGHTDNVYTLLVVNEKIISGSRDKTVRIFDPKSKRCLVTIPCENKVYSLAFSTDKQRLFVGLGCGDIEVFQIDF